MSIKTKVRLAKWLFHRVNVNLSHFCTRLLLYVINVVVHPKLNNSFLMNRPDIECNSRYVFAESLMLGGPISLLAIFWAIAKFLTATAHQQLDIFLFEAVEAEFLVKVDPFSENLFGNYTGFVFSDTIIWEINGRDIFRLETSRRIFFVPNSIIDIFLGSNFSLWVKVFFTIFSFKSVTEIVEYF